MTQVKTPFSAALDEQRQTLFMKLQGSARVRIVATPVNGGNTLIRSSVITAESDYRGKLVLSDLLPGEDQYRYEIRIDPITNTESQLTTLSKIA